MGVVRVAVVSHGSPDYQIDVVAEGLIAELGRENVHLSYRTIPLVNDVRYKHLMKGFAATHEPFPIEDADILVASTRRTFDTVMDWKKKTGRKRVAILDGEDTVVIRMDYLKEAMVYFKREFTPKRDYPSHVCPLPFAAIREPVPPPAPRSGFFFRGHYKTHRVRGMLAARLAKMGYKVPEGNVPKAEYNRALASSLIGISVRGWGWDTYRYWEIPYFGCCLLSERLGIIVPENFVEDQEAVFFSDMDEFEAKLRGLLADPARAAAIAARGHKACLARHMPINRARTVLDALE